MNDHILLVASAVSVLTCAHPKIREAMHAVEDGEHIFPAAVEACHKLERSTALCSIVGDIRSKFEGLSKYWGVSNTEIMPKINQARY